MQGESVDLNTQVALFTQETRSLEEAHAKLQEEFNTLRSKLEISHQTLEQIINHMSDGLLFVSQKGNITLYNPAAAHIMQIPQEGVLDTPFWEHFSDSLFGFPLANALKTGHLPGRIFLSLSNEKEIEVAPTLIPSKGILLLLNDRTELKRLEKSLQLNDRLKELGEMAATLAHEIRNPLGGIEGFASLLKRELQKPDEIRMVDAILTGSRALNLLVTNVLDYARPQVMHFAPTRLATLIEETAELSCASGHPCKVKIEKEYTLSIDAKRMQLVLLNLIRNAYESRARHVWLLLTEEGTIRVTDDGEGIKPELLEKIFTPFFTTKTKGSGLGLCEASKVMRAHGGNITIESNVGKGTSIILHYD